MGSDSIDNTRGRSKKYYGNQAAIKNGIRVENLLRHRFLCALHYYLLKTRILFDDIVQLLSSFDSSTVFKSSEHTSM